MSTLLAARAGSTPRSNTTADITVSIASDVDSTRWAEFVEQHAQAEIFHRWEWRGILAGAFAHTPQYLIAQRGASVVGVLPLAEVRTLLFGHSLISLPFASWAGPIANDAAALSALDDAAVNLAERLDVDQLEYRHLGESDRGWPNQDLYVAFMKSISADHDANLAEIPRKQRAMVRKGIKNDLRSSIEDIDAFHNLYADNVHRHGTPGAPKQFFRAMADAFEQQCEVLIVRDASGQALSGVLSLFHRDEVFPFYAGDTPAARNCAANDFKYWEVMRRAADAGYRRFNYGRSKRGTGSFSFKKNWGFEPQQLTYEYRLFKSDTIPEHNPLNPKYRLMIEAWRRMPRWLVNRLGPYVVRGLG